MKLHSFCLILFHCFPTALFLVFRLPIISITNFDRRGPNYPVRWVHDSWVRFGFKRFLRFVGANYWFLFANNNLLYNILACVTAASFVPSVIFVAGIQLVFFAFYFRCFKRRLFYCLSLTWKIQISTSKMIHFTERLRVKIEVINYCVGAILRV